VTTILLVEDSKFLRIATERIMTKEGYRVPSVGDGEEALRVAGREIPDLVILHMPPPKLSGPEVLRSLKDNPATKHIPVVVCTGLCQRNEDKLLREGAAAFVEKEPFLDPSRVAARANRGGTTAVSWGRHNRALKLYFVSIDTLALQTLPSARDLSTIGGVSSSRQRVSVLL